MEIGYLSAGLGCILFGVISHIENDNLFLLFAVLIRFLQGFGSACIQVAGKSILKI